MSKPLQNTMTVGVAYGRLWHGWMKQHKLKLVLCFLFMAVIAISSAGYAKFMQVIMEAFEERNLDVMYWGPAGVIGLTAIKGLSQYGQSQVMNLILSRIQSDMQRNMYNSLLHMDLRMLQAEAPSALAARFSADIDVIRLAVQEVIGSVTAVLTVTAAFAVMLSIDWAMTLGLILIFGLAFWPVGIIGTKVRRISTDTQAEIATMTETVNEGLAGIRMVRTYQLEGRLEEIGRGVFEKLFSYRVNMVRWQAIVSPLMEVLGGLAIAALLFLVAQRMQAGAIDLAGFIGLLTALAVATTPARRLGAGYSIALQGMAALERVFTLFDTENRIQDGADDLPGKAHGKLEFRKVDFQYPDGFQALRDIELTVEPGKTYAFVGRSGAGKSTIFNLLPRLYDVTNGEILLDGKDIRDLKLDALRRQISVVGQESVLLSASVMENIRFGRAGATDAECIQAAQDAAAHGFISALPRGYDTEIDPPNSGFSGGEKQRLSIARAILRDAPVLLLDEPTSALDAQSEAAIRAALADLSHGRTTLVIAHRLATILDADQIVVMDQGQIVEQGTHSELVSRGGIYADLFKLQFDQVPQETNKPKGRGRKALASALKKLGQS